MLDRVREALFSTLGDQVEGARVLDLFAGTGSLGLEALSRGAKEARFVERDRRALERLADNVQTLDYECLEYELPFMPWDEVPEGLPRPPAR